MKWFWRWLTRIRCSCRVCFMANRELDAALSEPKEVTDAER